MKANEYKIVADFIKKNGLEAAKKQIEFAKGKLLGPVGEWRVEYLKQFVESHELVEKMGGYERVKEAIEESKLIGWMHVSGQALQAIADVESCQPEQNIEQWIDEFRACGESGWSKYDDPIGEWLKEDRGE